MCHGFVAVGALYFSQSAPKSIDYYYSYPDYLKSPTFHRYIIFYNLNRLLGQKNDY